jgi:hypothetical protein
MILELTSELMLTSVFGWILPVPLTFCTICARLTGVTSTSCALSSLPRIMAKPPAPSAISTATTMMMRLRFFMAHFPVIQAMGASSMNAGRRWSARSVDYVRHRLRAPATG